MDIKLITYIMLIVIALSTSICSCLSFSSKNEYSSYLFRGLSFVAIMALGLFSANFNDNISATVIYILLGTAIYSLKIHDYKKLISTEPPKPKKEKEEKEEKSEIENEEENEKSKKKEKAKVTKVFKPNATSLTSGISSFIATVAFFGAELFLVNFNFLVLPIALFLGLACSLPFLFNTDKYSKIDLLVIFLVFFGAALMLAESILILTSGLNIINLLFAFSAVFIIASVFLSLFEHKPVVKCVNIALQYVALIILNACIFLI
ncbi:MAG: hypothetical protein IJ008_05420 [Clostridia bacterium]|nr:hypothetical protein [Clostridia bacterium]